MTTKAQPTGNNATATTATFEYWPFAGLALDPDQAAEQGCSHLHHVTTQGLCLSAVLADAYQSPPTTTSVIARAAFVGELVRLASIGGAA
jgi:hypothetical protein